MLTQMGTHRAENGSGRRRFLRSPRKDAQCQERDRNGQRKQGSILAGVDGSTPAAAGGPHVRRRCAMSLSPSCRCCPSPWRAGPNGCTRRPTLDRNGKRRAADHRLGARIARECNHRCGAAAPEFSGRSLVFIGLCAQRLPGQSMGLEDVTGRIMPRIPKGACRRGRRPG